MLFFPALIGASVLGFPVPGTLQASGYSAASTFTATVTESSSIRLTTIYQNSENWTSVGSVTSTTSSTSDKLRFSGGLWPHLSLVMLSSSGADCEGQTIVDCVNAYLANPISGVDGIVIYAQSSSEGFELIQPALALIPEAHQRNIAVGIVSNWMAGNSFSTYWASTGIDFVMDEESIGSYGQSPASFAVNFNTWKTGLKQVNPHILVGMEDSYGPITEALAVGAKPDFLSITNYAADNGYLFSSEAYALKSYGLPMSYFVGSGNIKYACQAESMGYSVYLWPGAVPPYSAVSMNQARSLLGNVANDCQNLSFIQIPNIYGGNVVLDLASPVFLFGAVVSMAGSMFGSVILVLKWKRSE